MATLEACINNTTSRKRKQRIFEFKSFEKSIGDHTGPFRDNIRSFVNSYGEQIEQHVNEHNVWSTLLICESNGAVFPLYTIEEHVNEHSPRSFCPHCKFAGWGHHFVCKRRYRFMIPSYGDKQPLRDYNQKNNLELDDSHILHGLIHCNGFGHLISINKLDSGSENSLTEADVMNFWDGICNSLKTRKVSVADVKVVKSMELRLIYGVAFKNSWFGNWGYKFGNGSFGVTKEEYRGSVRFLAELNLNDVINDFKNPHIRKKIQQIIYKYQELSEIRLSKLSELLQCMLKFRGILISTPLRKVSKHEHYTFDEESQNSMCLDQFLSSLMDAECRWPQQRVEHSLEVIVKLLKQKNDAISRHELRESAQEFVEDTGLIDFILKSINVLSFENYIIRRVVNSLTKLVEFEIREASYDSVNMKPVSSLWKLEPRWPKKRLETTAKVIANILKEHKSLTFGRNGAMSRKDLRNMASKYVGDTGLIDFVLKSIDNLVIGDYVVSRTKNPLTRLMEFKIRDQNSEELGGDGDGDVYGDILFLYRNVLLGYPLCNPGSQACRVVLNSKYFVKEWDFEVGNDELMTITCRVLPSFDELDTELTRPLPPGEVVLVTPWMTIGNLKEVAQCALRDTYCVMNKFVVRQIGGLKGIEDGVVLSCAVEAGAQVWVRGCGLDLGTALRYEGGDGYARESRVECGCGARDDDGERMVACDECHVWRHTKCCGIEDDEAAPVEFVCGECDAKSRSELLSQ